jgi:hypothetical protein
MESAHLSGRARMIRDASAASKSRGHFPGFYGRAEARALRAPSLIRDSQG